MNRIIYIVGAGMDGVNTLTGEGLAAVSSADVIIGARRVTEMFSHLGKPVFRCCDPKEIREYIEGCPYERIAAVMSGDCGFYSGARGLIRELRELSGYDVKAVAGISSLSYFCSRLMIPYENIKITSMHGKSSNTVRLACSNERVFALTGGENDPARACGRLTEYGRGDIKVYIGSDLGTADEKILRGNARDFVSEKFPPLSVMMTENSGYERSVPIGIPDGKFIRGSVPMTKSDIRAAVISRLEISAEDICWDIGSGTGSVSVEMAMHCPEGTVYAVEKNVEAARLTEENQRAFGCDNIVRIISEAPRGLEDIPAPDCVFIGGSGGRLKEIVNAALSKNPSARIVCTAVSLETLSECGCMGECEITQLFAAKAFKAGAHTMLRGEDPVFIIRRAV
ncbi:MAG: precorrin-6y C5,15-methyltransferase (decarboxylating) subunit CbiE [Ruminococcus sp.]|nr:precorrin-6y C5,15-methyltransferase (decarboxylating) subunit CbiE [Ruminococcus sp.]